MSDETVFRAMAHAYRRSIVMNLRGGEIEAGKILPRSMLSQPAASAHLQVLRKCGVIGFRRSGTKLMYRLNRAALRPIERFVATIERRPQR
jgi:DNA-binding transcriptional ArsR family regulator